MDGWNWLLIPPGQAGKVSLDSSNQERVFISAGHQSLDIPPGPGAYEAQAGKLLLVSADGAFPDPSFNSVQVHDGERIQGGHRSSFTVIDRVLTVATTLDDNLYVAQKVKPLEISAHLGSGWRMFISWLPSESGKDYLGIPPTVLAGREIAELRAKLDGIPSADRDRTTRWEWELTPIDPSPSFEADLLVREPWGEARFSPQLGSRSSVSICSQHDVTFPRVVVGQAYTLSVHDEDWRRVARTEFVFNGAPQVLVPDVSRLCSMELYSLAQATPIANAEVNLGFRFGSADVGGGEFRWSGDHQHRTDGEGRVTFSALTQIPSSAGTSWPPPSQGRLLIRAPGFKPKEVGLDWHGSAGGAYELGVVVLEHEEADLVLWLEGHSPAIIDEINSGRGFSARSFFMESWSLGESPEFTKLGLAVVDRDEYSDLLVSIESAKRQKAGLIARTPEWELAYFVNIDGKWEQVPSTRINLSVSAAESRLSLGPVRLGLTWRDSDVYVGRIRPAKGTSWSFEIPNDDPQLWVEGPALDGTLERQLVERNQAQPIVFQ